MDYQDSGIYKRFIDSQEESKPNQNSSKNQTGSIPSVNRIGQTNYQKGEPYFTNARYTGETVDSSFDKDQETDVKMKDSLRKSKRLDVSKPENALGVTGNESRDYDRNSNSSMNLETESAPNWMKMVLDPDITNEYFQREWPRISLGAPLRKGPGPLTLQNGQHEKSNEDQGYSKRRTRGTVLLVLGGLLLVIAIAVPIIVITVIMSDDSSQGLTEYYKVNMQLTVDTAFTDDHNNTQSETYMNFTRDLCSEIDVVYKSSTKYQTCEVTRLRSGSIIVEFSLYARVSTDSEARQYGSILNSSIESNSPSLGSFKVVIGSLIIISVQPVNSIPKPTTVLVETTTMADTTIQQDISTPQEIMSSEETTSTGIQETTSLMKTSTTMEITSSQKSSSTQETTSGHVQDPTSSLETTSLQESLNATEITSTQQTTYAKEATIYQETTSTIDKTSLRDLQSTQETTNPEESTSIYISTKTASEEVETSTHRTTSLQNDQTVGYSTLSVIAEKSTLPTETSSYPDNVRTTSPLNERPTNTSNSPNTMTSKLTTQDTTTLSTKKVQDITTDTTLQTKTSPIFNTQEGTTIGNTMTSIVPNETTTSNILNDVTTAVERTKTTSMDRTTSTSIHGKTSTTMDGTTSTAMDRTTSTGMDGITSTAMDGTTSTAMDGITSTAMHGTTSTAMDGTTSTAMDRTTSTGMDGITSTAMDGTTSKAMDGATSTAMDGTTSTAMDGTTSTAMDGTTSTAMDGTTTLTTTDGTTASKAMGATRTTINGPTITTMNAITTTIDGPTTATAIDKTTSPALDGTTSTTVDRTSMSTLESTEKTTETTSISRNEQINTEMTTQSPSESQSSVSTWADTTTTKQSTLIALMETTLNTDYSAAFSNRSSQEFSTFAASFCSEMTMAFGNESVGFGTDYSGCEVISIRNGSLIVEFKIYCLRIDVQESQFKDILDVYTLNGISINNELFAVKFTTVIQLTTDFSHPVTSTETQTSPDFETTTHFEGSSTENYNDLSVKCKDETFEIGSRAVVSCDVTGDTFNEIEIVRNDSMELSSATVYSNGTITYNGDVGFVVNYTANNKLELIFTSISCSDEGRYHVYLKENMVNQMSSVKINVHRLPSIPVLTMDPDQIIDLQFYRAGRENECSGDIGYPPGELIIEVKYRNGTNYTEIPPIDISFTTNETTAGSCSNIQLLKFGMNYTSDMDYGKIRCRVKSPLTNEDMSVEQDLFLIPRDICDCNSKKVGAKRGHPKRCDVYVECIDRIYPIGAKCPPNQCRNSIHGECSNNCSVAICEEEVPQSFCTTTPPPTTTPAPSPYITCNQSISALLYSEDIMISCFVNSSTQHGLINVTQISKQNIEEKIAEIQENGSVVLLTEENSQFVVYNMNTVTIILKNVSCSNAGTYRVYVQFPNEIAVAQTGFNVQRKPSIPRLKMNPDQIIDLHFYRGGYENECSGDIGHPPGELIIEVKYRNGTIYSQIPPVDISFTTNETTTESCSNVQLLKFGMNYTSDMDNGKIRCRVKSVLTNENVSAEEDLLLIPRDICACNSKNGVRRGHPKRCDVFVACDTQGFPFGAQCPVDQCRNSLNGECSNNCSIAICDEEVPQSFCTTAPPPTTTPAPSPYITCNQSISALIYSEDIMINCLVNSSAQYELINVTKISTQNREENVAQIQGNGNVDLMTSDNNLLVTYAANTLTIVIKNVSCSNEGTFRVKVQYPNDTAVAQTNFEVLREPSGYAELTLHPDQIPDIEMFRDWLLHNCTADVGYPAGDFQIEILLKGETRFKKLNYSVVKSNEITDNCMTRKTIEFGVIFSSEMEDAVIRCGVINNKFSDNVLVYSNNDTVVLIPSDFCEDAPTGSSYRQHPSDCTKFVQCESTKTYSKPCPATTCFGIDSVYSCDACSRVICEIPTTPELTTEAFEPTTITDDILNGIFCNESILVPILSEAVMITCVINSSVAFQFINVTKIISSNVQEDIAHVTGNGNVNLITQDANLGVSYNAFVLRLTIGIASCSDEANYKFTVKIGEKLAKAKTSIVILQQPSGFVELKLDADQILGLGSIRKSLPHICTADVGYPAGDLQIEMLLNGQSVYSKINTSMIEDISTVENCTTRKTLKFGLIFTTEMQDAVIRCGVTNKYFVDDVIVYSNEETVALIPNDFCINSNVTESKHQHPSDCTKYIRCVGTTTYGKFCQPGLCFGVTNVDNCNWCHQVVCESGLTTDAMETTGGVN